MDSRASAVPEVPVPEIARMEAAVRKRASDLLESARGVTGSAAVEIMHEVERLVDFADDLQGEQAMHTDQAARVCKQSTQSEGDRVARAC